MITQFREDCMNIFAKNAGYEGLAANFFPDGSAWDSKSNVTIQLIFKFGFGGELMRL
jgi:hypothetical protein